MITNDCDTSCLKRGDMPPLEDSGLSLYPPVVNVTGNDVGVSSNHNRLPVDLGHILHIISFFCLDI